ncbi:MAG: hypothetical protein EAZ07_04680 [Cytophagales bacterium]|nr:MAG: hypothetical protein EAZ07_04680 [Cytophagales bacterium]
MFDKDSIVDLAYLKSFNFYLLNGYTLKNVKLFRRYFKDGSIDIYYAKHIGIIYRESYRGNKKWNLIKYNIVQ